MKQYGGPYAPAPIPPEQPFKPNTGVEQTSRGFKEPSQNPPRQFSFVTAKGTLQDAAKLAKAVGMAQAARTGFDSMVDDIKKSKDWTP